jgi:hypothetical protein
MGPASASRDMDFKLQGSEAPSFSAGQDLYSWRKAVAEWVDMVTTAASQSSDCHFKTVRVTLGRQLYRALSASHRSVVDEAQARGAITYRQDDQVATVNELVHLQATDNPMAIASSQHSTKSSAASAGQRRTSAHLSLNFGVLPPTT